MILSCNILNLNNRFKTELICMFIEPALSGSGWANLVRKEKFLER